MEQKTGLECLKEELYKKGYTRSQVESKVVIGVLEIVSGQTEAYCNLDKLNKEIATLKIKKYDLEDQISKYETKNLNLAVQYEKILEDIHKECEKTNKEAMDYIQKFFDAINECETDEGRDALRRAQMFVNTINIDTKYDNTSFIIGLASILACGKTAPIDELRKINKKIPKVEVKAEIGKKYFYNGGKSEYLVDKKTKKPLLWDNEDIPLL